MDPLVEDTIIRLAVSKGLVTTRALEGAQARAGGPGHLLDGLETLPVLREEALGTIRPPPGGWPVRDWDRYRFLALIGEGGGGRVYKALDLRLDRIVALKFVHGSDPELLDRFRREAQALARVDHPGICGVHEVDVADGLHYIAMQFADGEPLGRAARRMTLEQKLTVVKEAAEALHEAHRAGLVHRDVKPGNIMVVHGSDGSWKPLVVDFGLARQVASVGTSQSGAVMGTPQYMSPEQARGRVHGLDRRSDVYSLGATLYSILTGSPPFEGPSLPDVLRRVIEEVPRAPCELHPDLPRDIESITMKCLRKNPEERYGSARELAEDLRRYLDGEPILARRTAFLYRVRMLIARNRREAATAAVALALLAVTGGWGIHHKLRSAQIQRLSQRFGQQVERVEALARYGALSPLHDAEPVREAIRDRMAAIDRTMREAGDVARGPGAYALGRGYLVLGDWDRARYELQRSRHAGYREPEAAWSLALALGRLYQRELAAADRIEGESERAAARERLAAEYRGRIVGLLRESRGVQVEAPEYVEALLAQYEGRWDDAVRKARAAFEGHPWLYEARQLEGEVRAAEAEERMTAGDLAGADEEFARAEDALHEAISVGSSDPATYLALASLEDRRMVVEMENRGDDVEPFFLHGKEAVEHALVARVQSPEALEILADLHRRMGEHLMARGGDPAEQLRLAVAAAERALEIHPRSAGALSKIGSAFRSLAKFEQATGRDPGASYARSAAAYEEARAIDPASVNLTHVGLLHKSRALWLLSRGEDPRPALEQAVAVFEDVRRRDPTDIGMLNNLGNAWMTFADYEETVSADPGASLEKAAEAFRAGLEVNPRQAVLLYGLGYSLNRQAQRVLEQGGDPRALLDHALDAYARGIDVNPRSAHLAFLQDGRGYAHLLRARFELSRGIDPGGSFGAAEVAFHAALEANPNHIYSCQSLAEAMILRAEHAIDAGEDPGTLLDRAVQCANLALGINPSATTPQLRLAESHRLHARELMERGEDPGDALEAGRAAIRRALEVNAGLAGAFVELGRLALLDARWQAVCGADPDPALAEADARLDEALRLRPVDFDGHLRRLELGVVRAHQLRAHGDPVASAIAEALREADAALGMRECDAEATALRALLLAEAAAAATDVGERDALLREADETMTAALERNENLRGRFSGDAQRIREARTGA